jgi:PAS domain S-box-containing protein/putative nucleotidyltransferase with HDIG domain
MQALPILETLPAPGDNPLWRTVSFAVWPPTVLALLAWLAADANYLLGHTLAEMFSIVVAVTALVVATTSLNFTRNHYVIYISVAIGWCAGLDLLHTLAFKGMHVLPAENANPATQLWIAARFMQAVALVSAPLFLRRTVRVGWLHLGFGTWSVLCTALIAYGKFPDAYRDNPGLTPFKIHTEYVIIALLGTSLLLLWRQRALMSRTLFFCMLASVATMMVSEFAFTRYVSVYAQANLVGHLLKIYAYWFVYVALVQSTLREPFGMLARAASTYDAVPDPTLIVESDGSIRQANRAAARQQDRPAEQLVGQSSHALFHDPATPVPACPVCSRLGGRNQGFTRELDLPQGRAAECSVAPFVEQGRNRAWVQVVRDITERRALVRERETLINDLGKRITELRCLYAASELIEKSDLPVPELLRGVVLLLPSGFMEPAQLQVAIDSDWGHFGAAASATDAQPQLLAGIELGTRIAGRMRVWYADAQDAPSRAFLPEEDAMVQNIARHLGETLERRQATERIQRLTYFYEMLSATNHTIVRSRSREDLLQSLFQTLLAHGTFPMLFIAMTDDGRMPLQLLQQHGIASEHLPQLASVLSDPASPLAKVYGELVHGKVVWTTLPGHGTPLPGPADAFDDWTRYLIAQGVTQRAVLPLLCEGRIHGVVGLYAGGLTEFDEEQLRLLNEMASDMSFALGTLASHERGQAAEQQAALMELRFEEVFRASPIPMQIHALDEHRIRAINDAHRRWLGYALDDIAIEDRWFEQAYPDSQTREQLRTLWLNDVGPARETAVESPELSLRSKDGRLHTARGTMTVVGRDAIIAWTDLTAMHENEKALRDSEQRFRGMVEQTISGMYVRRDGRYIYVNPRYCDIIGWRAEELIGQEVLHFTSPELDNVERIRQAWETLDSGKADNVSYSVPIVRKDGRLIELGLNAKLINWDDGLPATIVMAQDITERKQAEEQIAAYIGQLEGSMRGTLQAVSNMVEMRDPYTAGHERRVGLIASSVAAEMGWSAERCASLELLGLVHDIGKIAVPSEILTKPTRLSLLEMEMMKGHAEAGYQILKDVPFPEPVAEIIRQHHERMDGSGYPQGLVGAAILPEARVLAVADVVESMASHRPYRAAMGLDAALAELVQNRGRLYDTEVVDAAVRLVRERGFTLPA